VQISASVKGTVAALNIAASFFALVISTLSLPSERSINLLIGYDHAALLESSEVRAGTPGQPIARLTPLGWSCSVSPDKI
jgi:hypothetical protein